MYDQDNNYEPQYEETQPIEPMIDSPVVYEKPKIDFSKYTAAPKEQSKSKINFNKYISSAPMKTVKDGIDTPLTASAVAGNIYHSTVDPIEAILVGIGTGAAKTTAGLGIAGANLAGAIGDDTAKSWKKNTLDFLNEASKSSREKAPNTYAVSEFGGSLLMPGASGMASKALGAGAGLVPKIAAGAADAGLLSTAYNYSNLENQNANLQESITNAGVPGALIGGGITGAVSGLTSGLKGLLSGKVDPNRVAAEINMADELGLNPEVAKITGSKTGENLTNSLGSLPGSPIRKARFQNEESLEPAASRFILNTWHKNEANPGIIQSGLKKLHADELGIAEAKFKRAGVLAGKEGLEINVSPVRNYLDEQIAHYSSINSPEATKMVKDLTKRKDGLKDLSYDNLLSTLRFNSNEAYKAYRSSLSGSAVSDKYKLLYTLNDKYLDGLGISTKAINNGEARNALIDARMAYSQNVKGLADSGIDDLISGGTTLPAFFKTLEKDPVAYGGASKILSKLDQRTKDEIGLSILTTIMKDPAVKDANDYGKFIPQAFLKKLREINTTRPFIFGEHLDRLNTFTSLFEDTVEGIKSAHNKHSFNVGGMLGSMGAVGAGAAVYSNPGAVPFIGGAAGYLYTYAKLANSSTGARLLSQIAKAEATKADPKLIQILKSKATKEMGGIMKNAPAIYYGQATVPPPNQ